MENSNMFIMPTLCLNVRSVECGDSFTHRKNFLILNAMLYRRFLMKRHFLVDLHSKILIYYLIITVFVHQLNCHEPIEPLYYSAKYEPICIYCAKPQPFTDEKQYPICIECMKGMPKFSLLF